ncbi:MAG: SDR family oxidoreductase [Gammaproteobacteria bacterium]|nr:SDR family oxidoreductase [Gammaproteobacteria bacterium]
MKLLTHVCLLVALTLASSVTTIQASESSSKAVLVTGASSGIGLKITQVLAADGYFVYAGARKQQDLDALNKIENVQSIRLDVTKQDEIDAAVATVKKAGRGLYGLVNNAGVYAGGPLIEVDEDDMQWVMDVNVFGPYRITKAFAPMIIEAKGRITTISSIAGILTGPFSGPYSMSKHAVEAYADALAAELERFDVQVSVIEPGNYRSKISLNAGKRMAAKTLAKKDTLYQKEMQAMRDRVSDRSQHKEPDEVAAAVSHALFSDAPKHRYMVVPNQREAGWTIGKAIEEMVQLNADHPYSFSREQLVEMLDKALSAQQP